SRQRRIAVRSTQATGERLPVDDAQQILGADLAPRNDRDTTPAGEGTGRAGGAHAGRNLPELWMPRVPGKKSGNAQERNRGITHSEKRRIDAMMLAWGRNPQLI